MVYFLTRPGAIDYLAGRAAVAETLGRVMIVSCPEAEADWQFGRLISGLQHLSREHYPDLERARQAAHELTA